MERDEHRNGISEHATGRRPWPSAIRAVPVPPVTTRGRSRRGDAARLGGRGGYQGNGRRSHRGKGADRELGGGIRRPRLLAALRDQQNERDDQRHDGAGDDWEIAPGKAVGEPEDLRQGAHQPGGHRHRRRTGGAGAQHRLERLGERGDQPDGERQIPEGFGAQEHRGGEDGGDGAGEGRGAVGHGQGGRGRQHDRDRPRDDDHVARDLRHHAGLESVHQPSETADRGQRPRGGGDASSARVAQGPDQLGEHHSDAESRANIA